MRRTTAEAIAAQLTGNPLVVMLDIDGTLCDLVVHAHAAVVPKPVRTSLAALRDLSGRGVHVALVTGRSATDANSMVGVDGISIHGNHGMERLRADGTMRPPADDDASSVALRAAVIQLNALLAAFPGAGVEDKRYSLSVHYRGLATELVPEFISRVNAIVERNELRATPGKCVINVLPPSARNKGDAVREILDEAGITPSNAGDAAILFVGDDVTDEDAFVALRNVVRAVTVRVGDVQTDAAHASAAQLALDDPRAVQQLLQRLVELRA